jgi:hypothetical protein
VKVGDLVYYGWEIFTRSRPLGFVVDIHPIHHELCTVFWLDRCHVQLIDETLLKRVGADEKPPQI